METNFPIYIMHYTKNKERKRFIENQLLKEKINNYEFITAYDKESITQDILDEVFILTQEEVDRRKNHLKQICMLPEEASLCLKHELALRKFCDSNYRYCLFLEDDVILAHNFIEKFNYYFDKIPKDFDVGFIGQGGANARIQDVVEGKCWYKKFWPENVKCTDSIVFTKRMALKLLDAIERRKICFPIDHEYSYWFRELSTNVYWLEPPITSQGSQCGLFESFQVKYGSNYQNSELLTIRNDIEELL